ncbi:hypothetical protein SFBM_0634 [Candidatus Arthromitus sp. SFB-mouse-Japan]|uniref:tRNA (mnm(5)s(2)U34)-methyltransferase n=1 Tax=unclassified Candidatus Neoarthromitus TaxID=2638829 RepID=UPI00021B8023|nr:MULTISPECIES: class I SAM-dependent methyltransferase [unclassified Candidatus Arthromitus]EIA24142.1 Putative rRNA methylase [Candidatus Arthromitus sp. SFB-1]EIA29099.1 Putative rRNA methylase [Candidatus Arthromitus sp. SFB-co]EIA30683.1 Putative rRNA methylase [Candidatus Arthromitus sp. SFB-mouse-SU]EIA31134.1 hypothetical protein SFB4_023G1 [Candidatus Arthromitus sp. SFB-4]EIA31492.1 hypothetical protein SFB5_024G9 [Candidatus Arthromitus sp. SFB-5]
MSFYQITDTVKKLLLDNVKEKNISVDFTLGRGNDTIFLSENFNYVYSFDLQKECIDDFELKNIQNVKLILDSHENVDKYIDGFDCGMYNLGYLPGSNKEITTNAESTLISLYKAVNILNIGGFISIVLYIGHNQGKRESQEVLEFCSRLDNKRFNVAYLNLLNKNNPPSLVLINKMR